MPSRPCLGCQGLVPVPASWCAACSPNPHGTLELRGGSTAAATFRREVLRRADYRCEALDDDGERCPVTGAEHLQAHHVLPLRLGGDPVNPAGGVALCGPHHRRAEREAFARAARAHARAARAR